MSDLAEPYFRVADSSWFDPLDTAWSKVHGGRWNPAGAFRALYTNSSVALARAQVRHLHAGDPYDPEDLLEFAAPILVEVAIPDGEYADAVGDAGLGELGLPITYPVTPGGDPIDHVVCQGIGRALFNAGKRGIRCRSAVPAAPSESHELAWFDRDEGPRPRERRRMTFGSWYYSED